MSETNCDVTQVDAVCLPSFLRDYQADSIRAVLPHRGGIIQVPTGGGKTVIAAGLIEAVGGNWVYLVHRPSLARQTAEEFRSILKVPVAEIRRGKVEPKARILCATYDQILRNHRASYMLQSATGVIFDECHTVPRKSGVECAKMAAHANYRVGLSATPLMRRDDKNELIRRLIGPIRYTIDPDTLIAKESLTPLRFFWMPMPLAAFGYKGTWQNFYNEWIVNNPALTEQIANVVKVCLKPAIVFVKMREHGEAIQNALSFHMADPDRIRYVDGKTKQDERKQIVADINAGKIDVVVSTAVFYEGMNAPAIATVVVATEGDSAIQGIQRPGRATRVAADKTEAHIVDFAFTGHPWLHKHTLARYEAYKQAGFDPPHPFPELLNEKPDRLWLWILLVLAGLVTLLTVQGR